MASTRYLYGDDFSEADYAKMTQARASEAGTDFAARLQARLPGLVRCLAAKDMQTDHPTTVGLGDAFVGGFLEACLRSSLRRPMSRETDRGPSLDDVTLTGSRPYEM